LFIETGRGTRTQAELFHLSLAHINLERFGLGGAALASADFLSAPDWRAGGVYVEPW
jgi:hypothetical protein